MRDIARGTRRTDGTSFAYSVVMSVYVIDCGHGGGAQNGKSTAYGARGQSGVLEKDVTLALGQRLRSLLGGRVVLTRENDANPSLADRAAIAHHAGAEAFISLHAGESPGVWIHPRAGERSRALGASMHAALGARGYAAQIAELAVLTPERLSPHTAACLIEVGDVSDARDERRLRDPLELEALAHNIAGALGAQSTPRFGWAGELKRFKFKIRGGDPGTDETVHIPPASSGESCKLIVSGNVTSNAPRPITFQASAIPWAREPGSNQKKTLDPGFSGSYSFEWPNAMADADCLVGVWTPEVDKAVTIHGDVLVSVDCP